MSDYAVVEENGSYFTGIGLEMIGTSGRLGLVGTRLGLVTSDCFASFLYVSMYDLFGSLFFL